MKKDRFKVCMAAKLYCAVCCYVLAERMKNNITNFVTYLKMLSLQCHNKLGKLYMPQDIIVGHRASREA